MHDFINHLAFGWYPYFAVTVLVVGRILRFDADQFSWRSQSSQFLRRRQVVLGSNLFHMGVLILLVGHFVGLLTPVTVIDKLGISHSFKQIAAMLVGGVAGVAGFVGCSLLLHRRLFDPRIRRSSSWGDILMLVLIWCQFMLGISTTFWTAQHLEGEEMLKFMGWAQGLQTFNPSAAHLLIDVPMVYKLHIILGLTLFVITPFTRLVHVFSAPIWYIFRPGFQIVRTRGKRPRKTTRRRADTREALPAMEGLRCFARWPKADRRGHDKNSRHDRRDERVTVVRRHAGCLPERRLRLLRSRHTAATGLRGRPCDRRRDHARGHRTGNPASPRPRPANRMGRGRPRTGRTGAIGPGGQAPRSPPGKPSR
ncbi:respiratory nitrate reductase subunit gamma [Novosphingobium sp. ST904]|uniref:respiratory nitrate reductase subunit gamma n=1 Tax=Novosphingobium sp. ST904 TaxID=1684385 RepID=UPI0009EBC6DD|nr:respiratory nitrate reductase subunit gamma [Novosphingobium sp. ST904]